MAIRTGIAGLGTIEQIRPAAPNFVDFWPQAFLPAVLAQAERSPSLQASIKKDARIANGLGKVMAAFTQDLTESDGHGPSLGRLNRSTERYLPGKSEHIESLPAALVWWDRHTGSLNTMKGGKGSLLKSAALMLRAESPQGTDGPWQNNWKRPLKTFTMLREAGAFDRVGSTRHTGEAAEFVHKAALLEHEPNRRQRLLRYALELYESARATTPRTQQEWRIERLLHDVQFAQLDDDIAKFIRTHDNPAQSWQQDEALWGRAVGLLQSSSEALEQRRQQVESSGAVTEYGLVGESIGVLALRHAAYYRLATKRPHTFGARFAFSSEDTSARNIHLKDSFDGVLQKRGKDGNILSTTPLQFKLQINSPSIIGGGSSDAMIRPPDNQVEVVPEKGASHYLEPIVFVRFRLSPQDIAQISHSFIRSHREAAPSIKIPEPITAVLGQLGRRGIQAA